MLVLQKIMRLLALGIQAHLLICLSIQPLSAEYLQRSPLISVPFTICCLRIVTSHKRMCWSLFSDFKFSAAKVVGQANSVGQPIGRKLDCLIEVVQAKGTGNQCFCFWLELLSFDAVAAALNHSMGNDSLWRLQSFFRSCRTFGLASSGNPVISEAGDSN